nr:hypothetical protein [Sulfobacillus harzensis]
MAVVAAGGMVAGGFGLGVLLSRPAVRPDPTPSATVTPSTSPSPTTTAPTNRTFAVGTAFPFSTTVDTLQGQPTTLARGSKGTVVMAMASWCLYCAYEDKYVLPVLAKTPGVAVDVVDVSPQGGIGDPGPQNPPFSGHDGTGGALTTAGMEATMRQYVKTFGTLSASTIHVYVAPSATQAAWNVQTFPTLAFIGTTGKVAVAPAGAQTVSQAQADLRQAMRG